MFLDIRIWQRWWDRHQLISLGKGHGRIVSAIMLYYVRPREWKIPQIEENCHEIYNHKEKLVPVIWGSLEAAAFLVKLPYENSTQLTSLFLPCETRSRVPWKAVPRLLAYRSRETINGYLKPLVLWSFVMQDRKWIYTWWEVKIALGEDSVGPGGVHSCWPRLIDHQSFSIRTYYYPSE